MSIRINDLTVRFKNGVVAVNKASLEIPKGIYGLLGENGAGQSKKIYATFTKIIKEEKRVVTVTVPDMNKVSKSITVEPFFVNF